MNEKRMTLETFLGRDVSYSSEKTGIYDRLRDDSRSPFVKRTMADVFIFAAVFGFKYKKREKLKSPRPNITANAFDRGQTALLLTIPIMESGGIDVLFHNREAITIIEEYANGGIGLLEDQLLSSIDVDVVTKMASDLRNAARRHAQA